MAAGGAGRPRNSPRPSIHPARSARKIRPGAPLWQLKAVRVTHDQAEHKMEYRDAWLEIYGVPIAYTPYFSHPDPSVKRQTGLLVPNSPSPTALARPPGFAFFHPRPQRRRRPSSPSSPPSRGSCSAANTGACPHGRARDGWEHHARRPAGRGRGQRTRSTIMSCAGTSMPGPASTMTRTGVWARISNAPRTRPTGASTTTATSGPSPTNAFAERFDERSYGIGRSLWFQGLRDEDDNDEFPIIWPEAIYHYVGEPFGMGNYLTFDAGALNLSRSEGRDSRRLHSRAGWHLPFTSRHGYVLELGATLEADGYWVTRSTRTASRSIRWARRGRLHGTPLPAGLGRAALPVRPVQ